mmetsp:Transcript_24228/g.75390  ORF Transcript_24228/g.75390 Transcript_24228/m.75390 type:complete len:169 (-) Transcript_24228:148-654(-)
MAAVAQPAPAGGAQFVMMDDSDEEQEQGGAQPFGKMGPRSSLLARYDALESFSAAPESGPATFDMTGQAGSRMSRVSVASHRSSIAARYDALDNSSVPANDDGAPEAEPTPPPPELAAAVPAPAAPPEPAAPAATAELEQNTRRKPESSKKKSWFSCKCFEGLISGRR